MSVNSPRKAVHIASLARTVRENPSEIPNLRQKVQTGIAEVDGYPIAKGWAENLQISPADHDAKVEMRVLSAIIMDAVIERLIAERDNLPPYGLSRPTESQQNSPFSTALVSRLRPLSLPTSTDDAKFWQRIQNSLHHTLSTYLIDTLDSNQDKDLQKVIDGYLQLYRNGKTRDVGIEPPSFIKNGIGTSFHHMTNLLQLVPVILEREECHEFLNPSGKAQVAKASLPLLIQIAMLGLAELKRIEQKTFKKNPLDVDEWEKQYLLYSPEAFELCKSKCPVPRIVMKKEVLESIQAESDGDVPIVKTGCPAAVKFDKGGSTIKKLWYYLCDNFAPDLYKIT